MSCKSKQLSSHNDSIEYTKMKKKKQNLRQYFIMSLFLPQRSRRVHINCILSLFSFDFAGFCSYNKLNLYVILTQLFLYLHIAYLSYLVYEQEYKNQDNTFYLLYILTLIFCIYPIILTSIAISMFIKSLACSNDYGSVHAWHRNTIIKFVQNLVFEFTTFYSLVQYILQKYENNSAY